MYSVMELLMHNEEFQIVHNKCNDRFQFVEKQEKRRVEEKNEWKKNEKINKCRRHTYMNTVNNRAVV